MQEDWRKRAISWLGKNNVDQQDWAIIYLGKKGWFLRGRRLDESKYDYLVSHIRDAQEVRDNEDDLRKMKRAWTQKKTRDDKKGRTKSYSFIMSESVGPKLKYLKRDQGRPAYQIIETLVSDYHQERRTTAWLEMSQKQLEKRLEKVGQQLKEAESKGKELKAREEELRRQEAELNRRTEELGQLENEVLEYGEAVDNNTDLISRLLADYADAMNASALNQWVIRRKGSLPPAPLSYQGRSKAAHFLRPYHDLLANLER